MQITSLSLQSDTLGFISNILHHCYQKVVWRHCFCQSLEDIEETHKTFKLLSNTKEPILSISTVKIKQVNHFKTSYTGSVWYNFQKSVVLGKISNRNVVLSSERFWSPGTNCSVLTNQQCLFILPKSFQLKYSQCAIITESLSAFSSDNSIIRAMKGSFLLMISP